MQSPPGRPDVSIVVVTARRPDRLLRCLEAVAHAAPSGLSLEVVVVLNAADPEVRGRLADVEGARIVESSIPLGFAGGVNLGARHARGRLLHLLHDDTEVCPGWLAALAGALDTCPEAGAVGSMLLDFEGGVQTAGHVLWRDGSTSPPWLGPAPAADSLCHGAYPVDYCASASVLIRGAAWDAIGGLDEDFHPAYYVDVDLAMALRDRGYIVLCEPASRVRHERGGSSRETFRTFVSARNRELFVAKWASDLLHQQPVGVLEDDLARAREATARRSASVAASERSPAAIAGATAIEEEGELDRLRRERGQLQRDIAVKDAFIEHAELRLSEAHATRRRLEDDGVTAQRALAELHGAQADGHAVNVALARALEQSNAERDALARRADSERELAARLARALKVRCRRGLRRPLTALVRAGRRLPGIPRRHA